MPRVVHSPRQSGRPGRVWPSLWRQTERLERGLAAIGDRVGRLVAWSIPAMVLVVSYDVSMRFLFHRGSVALQELEWHLFSLVFLLGAAHTLRCGQHVRLDLCYRSRWLNDRRRAWIDLLGGLFFLVPFCLLVIASSWNFVSQSFVHAEVSPDPGGLPYRWLLKAAIPFGFGLLLLQGVADILGNLRRLFGEDR
ncbi:MAG: TRAP transporter small permease subunit [Gammaproteobacteria bacterium]|nr:TRAP transporter small permease subunit [Gammaproteobacteria bacterium]MDD9863681.1 TRAP transporter small permease subunit [Gammaproteobacteria bacterium]